MNIPFLDLKAQYQQISSEIDIAMRHVMSSGAFSGGPFVSRFEEKFAQFCQCKAAIGVGNGTEALWLALLGLGVGPGDEVITVPNSFIATAEAISMCGATPVFVDVNETYYTMDPKLLEGAITPRTKAVIPVHLYGQTANMDPIMEIAKRHGLFVVEDACQAHGAEYRGKRAGSIGDAGCFSFYPGKNLGAYGEAGGIVTNNPDLAEKIRILRDHGQSRKYHHEIVGMNCRMDGLQGAVLEVKLRHLADWNAKRVKNAEMYRKQLEGLFGIILPEQADYAYHIYHVFALRVTNRDSFFASMTEQGISCGIHYPVPIHLQPAYSSLGIPKGTYPVSERVAEELISLPMFPELAEEQIEYICNAIRRYYRNGRLKAA